MRILLIIACTLSVAILLNGCGSKHLTKNLELGDVINEAEKKSSLIKQFRTEFVKTRRNSVFNREMKAKGVLLFQKPNKFQLTLTGDINVEILSNGKIITMTHDGSDVEVFKIHGERDLSKFADPLMLLIQSVGNGSLRKFSVMKSEQHDDVLTTEIVPSNQNEFERIQSVNLAIMESGEIKKVAIKFKNGDVDETEFASWSLLAQDDPQILSLNQRLNQISENQRYEAQDIKGRENQEEDEDKGVVDSSLAQRMPTYFPEGN
ncbi:LolA family protein [Desulfomonile tiedjei]|uniref:Outer membrane lipoprotein-sorting protein n=1 Tax=Desulfomonile tiedjei (strain ATCC 49306 / DSM 6799 / DCB-1) TaxID=706587 RepID=I4C6Q5_DESTA|nr:outer membrane lipoprotein carrier protein LolA [Desulfomonile tiedjei]AFM25246.1 outer membrane lipoprotein-sorting protein [Desulfomonile tiedjei DSM 6799]